MGLQFRKRIKIMPGVTLNFSKSGISFTVGVRGMSVNLSKRGIGTSVGIPGTGVGFRKNIPLPKELPAAKVDSEECEVATPDLEDEDGS